MERFLWTADIFDIGYSECYKLDDAVTKLKDNNYIIASCNQGLFTYGVTFYSFNWCRRRLYRSMIHICIMENLMYLAVED